MIPVETKNMLPLCFTPKPPPNSVSAGEKYHKCDAVSQCNVLYIWTLISQHLYLPLSMWNKALFSRMWFKMNSCWSSTSLTKTFGGEGSWCICVGCRLRQGQILESGRRSIWDQRLVSGGINLPHVINDVLLWNPCLHSCKHSHCTNEFLFSCKQNETGSKSFLYIRFTFLLFLQVLQLVVFGFIITIGLAILTSAVELYPLMNQVLQKENPDLWCTRVTIASQE